jgi:hypothetical protein
MNNDIGKAPFFRRAINNVSDDLFTRYQYLNSDTMWSLKYSSSPEHLPDGAVVFKKANNTRL